MNETPLAAAQAVKQEAQAAQQEAQVVQQEAKAAPAPDPDRLVAKLVAEAQGVADPAPKKKPAAYATPPEGDVDAAVHLEVVKLLQREQRKADAAARARKGTGRNIQEEDRGRAPIELGIEAPEMPNELAFEDDDGTPLLLPGHRGRWVRVKESLDQRADNTIRMRRLGAWGATPIKKKNGDLLRMETLVAMQIPIQQDAKRIIRASPSGAFDTAKQIDQLHQSADRINSDMSRRYHGLSQGVIGLVEGDNSRLRETEDVLDRGD